MNVRSTVSALSFSVFAALAACDRDSKVFTDADLAGERSVVAGRVTGQGDSGLVGVVVSAVAVDAKGAALSDVPGQTALTGEGGRYALELHPGLRWRISWQSPDYQTPDGGVSVDLGLRETRSLPDERLLYRYGVVAGRTIPGAAVAIEGQDAGTVAGDDGSFRIERVLPGRVEIVGVVRGKGYWKALDSVASESTSTIEPRQQTATWKPLATLTGTLVNSDGSPQSGAVLTALGGLLRDTTDVQGRFRFDALPADGRVVFNVLRGLGTVDRVVLPTPPEDSTWDLGALPMTGSVTSEGVLVADALVVADSGEAVPLPLLWKLVDTARTVIGFAWDTSGVGSVSRAVRTWGPRLGGFRLGGRDRTVSAWVCVAAPRSDGGFDTAWSHEATIRVRVRRAQQADTVAAPLFSARTDTVWTAPFKLGLDAPSTTSAVYWSTDSVRWSAWDPDDSIALYDTTTVWTFTRETGRVDSRIVRSTFLVRPSARPETLQAAIVADTRLPQGSIWEAYQCPSLSPGVSLTLDSGASLTLPANCPLEVDDDARLEMRAGSSLIVRPGTRIVVGGSTSGTFVVAARLGRRASIRPLDPSAPGGYVEDYLVRFGAASGASRVVGLDLLGSTGDGLQFESGAEVDVVDSRIRGCKGAGIVYQGTARPASAGGVSGDSVSGCRWSVSTTPYALDRIATNPGFEDTVHVGGDSPAENAVWLPQALPLRLDGLVTIDDQGSVELAPGLELRMGADARFDVYNGVLRARGTRAKPVRILPANRALPWGYLDGSAGYGIQVRANSYAEFAFTEISGTRGSAISAEGRVRLSDTRLDSNAYAGIRFANAGAPEDDDSAFARVVARGNLWSVSASPLALSRMRSCPGLADTILVENSEPLTGNGRWRTQKAPVLFTSMSVDLGDAVLTVDSATTYVFSQGARIDVGSAGGGLVVAGGANAPVQFVGRNAAGWGYLPTSSSGYAVYFRPTTSVADLRHLRLTGAQTNGIYFSGTQSGVGSIEDVVVERTKSPTDATFGLYIERALPAIAKGGYSGTCYDAQAGICP